MKILFVIFFIIKLIFLSYTFGINLDINNLKIITREQRGADESFRYASREEYKRLSEQQKKYIENLKKHYKKYQNYIKQKEKNKIINEYLQKYRLNEIKIDKVIKYENGNKLRWPLQYHYNKTKIVIHHTASEYKKLKTPEDVKKFLRGIYRYHAFTRGWGDLGYNYVIDQFGNIYEGRAGGKGVIGAHAQWNNSPSIGIALIGNFEKEKPTKKQIISLIKLILYLGKEYNIDLNKKTTRHKPSWKYPYIQDITLPNIVGHKDVGYTKCPGNNLYKILPKLRKAIYKLQKKYNLKNNQKKYNYHLTSYNKTSANTYTTKKQNKLKRLKESFIKKNKPILAKYKTKKINYKIYLSEAKKLLQKDIKVLLYELTTKYRRYNIKCNPYCKIYINNKYIGKIKNINIKKGEKKIYINGKTIPSNKIKQIILDSDKGYIKITNYNRKSFSGIPWNIFKGKIILKKDYYKDINKKLHYDRVIINQLPFSEYLKGIAESNDQQPLEKSKVMAMIAKTYALFYMRNKHPNIPYNASYNAVDDPRIFQKYVGAGFEKTSQTRPKALNATKNYIVLYNGYIPILPYFNSSAGFTFSAEEKFGWIDTPYLKSKIDFYKGKYFNGHGVGLSGKGAAIMAQKGYNWKEILKYYYEGIDIVKIK